MVLTLRIWLMNLIGTFIDAIEPSDSGICIFTKDWLSGERIALGNLSNTNAISPLQVIRQRIESISNSSSETVVNLTAGVWLSVVASASDRKSPVKANFLGRPAQLLVGEIVARVDFDPEAPLRIGFFLSSGFLFSFCPSKDSLNQNWSRMTGKQITEVTESEEDNELTFKLDDEDRVCIPTKYPPLDDSINCAYLEIGKPVPFLVEWGSEIESLENSHEDNLV
jgi:hypothetical protein